MWLDSYLDKSFKRPVQTDFSVPLFETGLELISKRQCLPIATCVVWTLYVRISESFDEALSLALPLTHPYELLPILTQEGIFSNATSVKFVVPYSWVCFLWRISRTFPCRGGQQLSGIRPKFIPHFNGKTALSGKKITVVWGVSAGHWGELGSCQICLSWGW